MAEYIKLVDVSRCAGCRGCQVACKQWNELPAEKTGFTGSYQNPPDLSFDTWNLIRYDEIEQDGKLRWIMRHDACMHCDHPACVKVCPTGALAKTDEGAVIHDPKLCIGCKACTAGCPFDVPRYSKAADKIAKCTLCYSRITNGRTPACVMACPTGCLSFGNKDEMMEKAIKRAETINGTVYPNNPKYPTHVVCVFPNNIKASDLSHTNPHPSMPLLVLLWKNLLKPFTLLGIGAVAGGAALHYLIKGPHEVHEKKEGGE
jgi:formate dehydrogenase beta subunit